jgi:hypothetical protein
MAWTGTALPFFLMARQPLGGLGRLIFRGFTITLFRHTTLSRTPLDEGPARRRDLYLTTHNTHKRQTSMPPVVFEPIILVSERPQTHALDRTATGIGALPSYLYDIWGTDGSDYEYCYFLEYKAMYCDRNLQTFRRNLMSPSYTLRIMVPRTT